MSPEQKAQLDSLLAQLADGDRAAFTPVFRLLWQPVLRLCANMLKNDADAADAAQLALEKVLTRCGDYDRTRSALPWALAIAAWECRTFARKRTRRREIPEDHAPDFGAGSEEELAQRELTQAAVAALGELSAQDREALVATFWEEAANVGGATLRKRRERALKRLRQTFKRLYGLD
ncbi:MAG TPA: sigma-70 family RNA polymerase sigma factor [Polyangiaceae bacterium]|nr:sigma-70 family RNA polymerase sigma factor [Polyangiaceae bacterium]